MADPISTAGSSRRALLGFIAGFLATLIFHQLTLWVLWSTGFAPVPPFSLAATKPLGVPAVISLAFWGGIWGIVFSLVERRFSAGWSYWLSALVFGAVFPTAVALLLVMPLKGRPLGGGWQPSLWVAALLVNGAWGIGTALFIKLMSKNFGRSGFKPV